MSRSICLGTLGCFLAFTEAEDIRNDISSAGSATLRFQSQGNLYMWLSFGIGVILWILSKALLTDISVDLKNDSRAGTLKTMKSSIDVFPVRTFSPTVVKYS